MRTLRRTWILVPGVLIGDGFYMLLIDTPSLPELYALLGVTLGCAVAFALALEQGFVEARLRARWLAAGWRIIFKIPPDIVRLCGEALAQLVSPRQARGVFRAVDFRATADTPLDVGRRALTEWLGSMSPNTIVVGVDPDRRLLLVHQLRRQGDHDNVDPLGLG